MTGVAHANQDHVHTLHYKHGFYVHNGPYTSELLLALKRTEHQKLKGGGTLLHDTCRVYVRGGTGGKGLEKIGGIGGDGGDVYLQASSRMTLARLLKFNPSKRFIAKRGENSSRLKLLGNKGADLVVSVPLGVTLTSEDGELKTDLDVEKDKVLVANGGEGGSPATDYIGIKPEHQIIRFDLKLLADVGLIGFPNAGKSTLLKAISRAKPKIASYPFTTIRPQLGMIEYPDGRQITIADLPGLIEGAYRNVGMGHKFLKHVERTSILLVVVDVFGFQLNDSSPFRNAFETLMLLNKELELYRADLMDKPAVLCLNKMDLNGAQEKADRLLYKLDNKQESFNDLPEDLRSNKILNFAEVVQVSAKQQNIGNLPIVLRTLLDKIDDEKRCSQTDTSSQLIAAHDNSKDYGYV